MSIQHLEQRIAALESLFSAARVAPQHHGTPIGLPIPFIHREGTLASDGTFQIRDDSAYNPIGSMQACGLSGEAGSPTAPYTILKAWRGGAFLCIFTVNLSTLPTSATANRNIRSEFVVAGTGSFVHPQYEEKVNTSHGQITPSMAINDTVVDYRGLRYLTHTAFVALKEAGSLSVKIVGNPAIPTQSSGIPAALTLIRLGPVHESELNWFSQYHETGSGPGVGGGGGGA